jgi:hypothetical protein
MTYVAEYSAGYGWVLKTAIVAVGAIIWGVVNHARKTKLADEFHLDPKVVLPFKEATCRWEEESAPESTTFPAWAWVVAACLLVAAVWLTFLCLEAKRNWEYYLYASVASFLLCMAVVFFSRVQVPSVVSRCSSDFSESRISVVQNDQTAVFEVGKSLMIVVIVEEAIRKRGYGQMEWDEFLGFRYRLSLRDGYRDRTIPMDFVGSGEFLAACSHRGAKVEFDTACPDWFVKKMKALPSWQPGYFKEAPPLEGAVKIEMACAACGGRGQYAKSGTLNLCQYCGSGKLRPA